MFATFARLVLDHPRAAVLGVLALLLVSFAGASQLRLDFSALSFFGGDDPALAELRAFESRWGAADDGVVVLVTAEDGGLVLEPARLRTLDRLTQALAGTEGVAAVLSITQAAMLRSPGEGLDTTTVIDAMPDVPASDPAFLAFRTSLQGHPLYQPTLVSADGRAAAVQVELSGDTDDLAAVAPVVERVRAVLRSHEVEGLRYGTAGIPAVRADLVAAISRDQALIIPSTAFLVGALLLLTFRRFHAAAIPGVAAFVPTLVTFGLMGWTDEPLGLLNQAYTTLLPVLAISDAIHMVSRFHEELRARVGPGVVPEPGVRREAIIAAVQHTGAACAFNSLTTSLGFFSLMTADMPVLRSFGLYAAVGVLAMYVTVLVIVPLALARTSSPAPGRNDQPDGLDRWMQRIAGVSTNRPRAVLAIAAGLLVFGLWLGRSVVVDNRLTAMLHAEHETVRASAVVEEKLGGVLPVEIDLLGAPGSLYEPAVLRALDGLSAWARTQDVVRAVWGPAEWIRTLHQAVANQDAVPATRAAVAQLALLAEGDAWSARILDPSDQSRGRMTILCEDGGARRMVPFSDALQAQATERLAGTGVRAVVTGTPTIAYRGINRVTEDLMPGLAGAFLVMIAIFAAILRSPRAGLLAVVPNAVPLVAGYAVMGWMRWPLDPSPAVVFTVALGIASDDTVHLCMRTREEVRSGASMVDALRTAIAHSGRACVVTSCVLSVGFLLNTLSSFPSLDVLGWLGFATLVAAMVAELFLTPALFALFGKDLWRNR